MAVFESLNPYMWRLAIKNDVRISFLRIVIPLYMGFMTTKTASAPDIYLNAYLFRMTFLFHHRLSRLCQDGSQIFGKHLGVEILIDGQDGFSAPVFDFGTRFHRFVIFFHRPTVVIQFFENRIWITLGV